MTSQSGLQVGGPVRTQRHGTRDSRTSRWIRGQHGAALLPGLLLVAAIVGAAYALRQVPGLGLLSPMIIAIVLGIGVRNVIGLPAAAKTGVTFSMRRLLRLGIILLGLQLTAAHFLTVGAAGMAIIVVALVATFAATLWVGRLIGVDARLAQLIAAGTSICGASAVIAANSVTEAPEEDVAYAVACVTLFGSIAMLVYPLLPGVLELAPHSYGLWAGASIHEIAQVVAATFQGGTQAGEYGTIAKLSRVMMLAPTVLALGYLAACRAGGEGSGKAKAPVPWFVLGFVAMVGVNSIVSIPSEATAAFGIIAVVLLSLGLAAMGLETDIGKLRAKGARPLLLGLVASLFISGLSLTLVKLTT
ncbi:MAG TPA: putative sulfate exporter family transporter [Hyphomicrobiaceae bacterium]|nr:putative sulfate exporter family transporter [Hyphomicrobiaceae bacterium]